MAPMHSGLPAREVCCDAKVPLKSIGDLLGHRSATSTEIYLRLATDDLRAISLDLPGKENGCRPGPTKKKPC